MACWQSSRPSCCISAGVRCDRAGLARSTRRARRRMARSLTHQNDATIGQGAPRNAKRTSAWRHSARRGRTGCRRASIWRWGSALVSIGLTIPVVAAVLIIIKQPIELGLGPKDQVLLAITLIVSVITFGTGRTTVL